MTPTGILRGLPEGASPQQRQVSQQVDLARRVEALERRQLPQQQSARAIAEGDLFPTTTEAIGPSVTVQVPSNRNLVGIYAEFIAFDHTGNFDNEHFVARIEEPTDGGLNLAVIGSNEFTSTPETFTTGPLTQLDLDTTASAGLGAEDAKLYFPKGFGGLVHRRATPGTRTYTLVFETSVGTDPEITVRDPELWVWVL